MALSNEDKKDVSRAFGKKAASAVSRATRDSINSRIELNRAASGGGAEGRVPHKYGSSKSKALKSKTSISLERQSAHNAMRDKGVAEHWMRKLKND